MSRIYQCCYTNAQVGIDGVSAPGWQTVAATQGIPGAALEACSRLQNINSSMSGSMTDESGYVLNLLEVQGDDAYLYLLRTQYGLLERAGRANMFSHGFVVPWGEDDALHDPNAFLSIADSNFKSTTKEATGANERLVRSAGFELGRTLADLDIDSSEYLTLIQCVYAKMTESFITAPLYVQYDGTSEQMRKVLYCIYLGLPYYLRKRLSAASCETPNTGNKVLVFSIRANRHQFYVIPGTGENNVISKRLERKIARVGFADYAVRCLDHSAFNQYYDALAQTALSLGDEKAANPLALKVAHRIVTAPDVHTYDNDTLEISASDALLSGLVGAPGMERRIAELLSELYARDLDLTDDAEAYLDDWISNSTTQELANAGERYRVSRFSRMPEEQAAAKLIYMRGGNLRSYLRRLVDTERGSRIVDLYFEKHAIPMASSSWEKLAQVLDDASVVPERSRIIDAIQASAWNLYCSKLDDTSGVVDAYEAYLKLMGKMVAPDDMEGCAQAAREEFWKHVGYENFEAAYEAVYRKMAIEDAVCRKILALFDVRKLLKGERVVPEVPRRKAKQKQPALTTPYIPPTPKAMPASYTVQPPVAHVDEPERPTAQTATSSGGVTVPPLPDYMFNNTGRLGETRPTRRSDSASTAQSAATRERLASVPDPADEGSRRAASPGYPGAAVEQGLPAERKMQAVSMPGQKGSFDDEAILKGLSKYAACFLHDASGMNLGELQKFKNLLKRLIQFDYAGSDECVSTWAEASLRLPHESKALNRLLSLRYCVNAVREGSFVSSGCTYEQFSENYAEVRKALNDKHASEECAAIDDLVYDTVIALDDWASQDGWGFVPLDLWIEIGAAYHHNPFEVFDEITPIVVRVDSEEVVKGSHYLNTTEGMKMADAYVLRRESREQRTVKSWLKVLRKPKKQQGKGGFGGFLSSFGRR